MRPSDPEERARQKKIRAQEKMQARKPGRVTYDLPPALRERIRRLAAEQGLPASQLVTLALLRFLSDFEQGEVTLGRWKEPSRSPRYDWNLALEEYPTDSPPKRKKKRFG